MRDAAFFKHNVFKGCIGKLCCIRYYPEFIKIIAVVNLEHVPIISKSLFCKEIGILFMPILYAKHEGNK